MPKKTTLLLLILVFTTGLVFSNNRTTDSLKACLSKTGRDTNRVKLWVRIANEYRTDYDLCMKYSDSAFSLSEQLNYNDGMGLGYYFKGMASFIAEKKTEALVFYKKALPFLNKAKNLPKEADCVFMIGSVNMILGNYADAAEYLIESSKTYVILKDTAKLEMCLNNISIAFSSSGENILAEKYLLKALEINRSVGDSASIFSSYINLGSVMNSMKQFQKAVDYFKLALTIAENLNENNFLFSAYGSLGVSMNSLGEYRKAIEYLEKAISYGSELKSLQGEVYSIEDMLLSYCALSNAYIHLKNWDKALISLKEADALKNAESNLTSIEMILNYYAVIFEGMGKYKEALEYHKSSKNIRDSIYTIEHAEKIAGLSVKYETENKEHQLQLQEVKISDQKKINEQKNIQLWIAGISLFIVLVLAIFVYRNYTQVKKQKVIIEQKNKDNELLLGEIHHRVKNNLQVISSLLSLQERDVSDASVKSAILEGKERVKSMELVHKMLYRENKFSGIEMYDYVNNLSLGLFESFGLGKNDVMLNAPFKPITLDVDTAVPLGLILNELIINSLKHARQTSEKLHLTIEMYQNNSKLIVTISDNGKGRISDIENSDSFGLKIVKSLIRQLKGTMTIKEESGLHYFIELNNYKLIT